MNEREQEPERKESARALTSAYSFSRLGASLPHNVSLSFSVSSSTMKFSVSIVAVAVDDDDDAAAVMCTLRVLIAF